MPPKRTSVRKGPSCSTRVSKRGKVEPDVEDESEGTTISDSSQSGGRRKNQSANATAEVAHSTGSTSIVSGRGTTVTFKPEDAEIKGRKVLERAKSSETPRNSARRSSESSQDSGQLSAVAGSSVTSASSGEGSTALEGIANTQCTNCKNVAARIKHYQDKVANLVAMNEIDFTGTTDFLRDQVKELTKVAETAAEQVKSSMKIAARATSACAGAESQTKERGRHLATTQRLHLQEKARHHAAEKQLREDLEAIKEESETTKRLLAQTQADLESERSKVRQLQLLHGTPSRGTSSPEAANVNDGVETGWVSRYGSISCDLDSLKRKVEASSGGSGSGGSSSLPLDQADYKARSTTLEIPSSNNLRLAAGSTNLRASSARQGHGNDTLTIRVCDQVAY